MIPVKGPPGPSASILNVPGVGSVQTLLCSAQALCSALLPPPPPHLSAPFSLFLLQSFPLFFLSSHSMFSLQTGDAQGIPNPSGVQEPRASQAFHAREVQAPHWPPVPRRPGTPTQHLPPFALVLRMRLHGGGGLPSGHRLLGERTAPQIGKHQGLSDHPGCWESLGDGAESVAMEGW